MNVRCTKGVHWDRIPTLPVVYVSQKVNDYLGEVLDEPEIVRADG